LYKATFDAFRKKAMSGTLETADNLQFKMEIGEIGVYAGQIDRFRTSLPSE
jgi:hypothetical protein